MHLRLRQLTTIATTISALALGACGGDHSRDNSTAAGDVAPAATTPVTTLDSVTVQPHHSKVAGALVGAAVGHVLGGHAVAGAAAGAIVQHERNRRP
ncbi:MAG TPA: hypothetical protein VGM82_13330 [Gemmatimonadaceae bacterium]|jgi:outer membrane lipoprotein SlyB